jgi:hypothetical protein
LDIDFVLDVELVESAEATVCLLAHLGHFTTRPAISGFADKTTPHDVQEKRINGRSDKGRLKSGRHKVRL